MVTLTNVENALKDVYLGVVANQLNVSTNPLLAKIKRTTKDVWGKEIVKMAPYGLNGGVGAGGETAILPGAFGNKYAQFRATLKNLYGKIEISDKAVRSTANNMGAFVNLLQDEMEGLLKASSFNLGRMLYGDGTGKLGTALYTESDGGNIVCDKVNNLVEGMVIDMINETTGLTDYARCRVTYVDRVNKKIRIDKMNIRVLESKPYGMYVQGSYNNEITGIGALFNGSTTLYGLTRADYLWLNPYKSTEEKEVSDNMIQTAIDFLDENADSKVNYISCSSKVRRAYQQYMNAYKSNIEIVDLGEGFKAISYNGIPMFADRFVDEDTMYLLNTNDFTMHELCDWQWIEGDSGHILKQTPSYPTYSATLVKYAELICDRPNGQAKISGIKSTITNPLNLTANVTCECNCASSSTTTGTQEPGGSDGV